MKPLQFSCFENNLSVKIENNNNLKEQETKYGKTFYSLSINGISSDTIILIVYKKEEKNNNVEYFTFQYSNSNDENYNKYSIPDTGINVAKKIKTKTTADYTITLKPVNNYNQYKIAYIIRAIYKVDFPSKPDIIVKLNKQYVKEFYNPTPSNGELSLEMSDISQGIKYIQVLVQIDNEGNLEYLSYDLKLLNEPESSEDEGGDNKKDDNKNKNKNEKNNNGALIVILIIGSMLFIVVVVLIIIVILFNNKNKNLLDQVNQISFAQSLSKGDNDLLADKEDEKNIIN